MLSFVSVLAFGCVAVQSAVINAPIFNGTTNATHFLTQPVILLTTTLAPVIINKTEIIVNVTEIPVTTTERPWIHWTVQDFFIKVIRGEVIGARHCKKDHQCGAGLKCNQFWNWCTPLDVPAWEEYTNNCTVNEDCNDQYYCTTLGRCRIAGPRACLTELDCADGLNKTRDFDCIDIKDFEERALLVQLGRPEERPKPTKKHDHKHKHDHDDDDKKDRDERDHHHHHDDDELGSEEKAKFGSEAEGDHLMHGKRCWSKCAVDADCGFLRYPDWLIKKHFGCCNGYCTRRLSCVSVPEIFRATTTTFTPVVQVVNKTKTVVTDRKFFI